jgi:glycosyltransferase involved in cell wall biosynthesis
MTTLSEHENIFQSGIHKVSKGQYSISAFYPAYNDAGSIGPLVRATASMLPNLTNDYEIVVVNDGSADETGKVLGSLAAEYPFLKVIEHRVNRGYGAALITGFAHCTKDLIFYTDGDGQYDVNELPLLLKAFGEKVDLVNGYKISRSDPLHRIILGRVYQHLMRFMFQLSIRDVDCDFRLFRRSLLADTRLTYESGVICVEMMKKFETRGCRIVEVPVHHYPRSHGSSQFFTFKHLGMIFGQLFAAWCKLVAAPKFSLHSRSSHLEMTARKSEAEIE